MRFTVGLAIALLNAITLVSTAMAQTPSPDMGQTGIDMIPTDLPARATSVPTGNQPVSLLPGTIPTSANITEQTEIPSLADQYHRSITGQAPPTATKPVSSPASPTTASVNTTPSAMPTQRTVTSTSDSVNPVETAAPADQNRHFIQLGAFRDSFTAETYWASFSIRYPKLSKAHDKQIISADLGSQGTYHRLQLLGFADAASAQKQCRQLKADGTDCFAPDR
ncbi:SPOR domain-containing protein [Thalassospira sp. UBA848]|uniref:SPOR domain-containing protein n=2 Tax=unclassified Thalassospira TaxID=2648997 RepID=UPI0025FAAA5C|nr:SPOR domain-containing protein [Thalassospira sp. UBA848]